MAKDELVITGICERDKQLLRHACFVNGTDMSAVLRPVVLRIIGYIEKHGEIPDVKLVRKKNRTEPEKDPTNQG